MLLFWKFKFVKICKNGKMFTWIWVFSLYVWKMETLFLKIKRSKVTDYATLKKICQDPPPLKKTSPPTQPLPTPIDTWTNILDQDTLHRESIQSACRCQTTVSYEMSIYYSHEILFFDPYQVLWADWIIWWGSNLDPFYQKPYDLAPRL